MDFLYSLLIFFHIVGAAALLGGWLARFKNPTVGFWQHLGAWIQLVSGLLLVAVAEMTADDGSGLNNMKIGVKTLVLIAILITAIIGRRKVKRGGEVPTGIAHSVGGLTLVNVALAVFW